MKNNQSIKTRKGEIAIPAYVPVTTFGADKFPLDKLLLPYLPRLASALMISYYYAKNKPPDCSIPRLPLMIDSGGFASLFKGNSVEEVRGLGVLRIGTGETAETVHPRDVLELQEDMAEIAFTLDFPIPPGMERAEGERRQRLTIENALWAVSNCRRRDLPMYACIQAWDVPSAKACAKEYVGKGFKGVAIGGLVPRSKDLPLLLSIVEAVREEVGEEMLIHALGIGNPPTVEALFKAGVNSVDSSSYAKLAADGRVWGNPDFQLDDPSLTDRLHLALCNLATATGKTLPLSFSGTMFSTFNVRPGN